MKNVLGLFFTVLLVITGLSNATTIEWVSDDVSSAFDQPWIDLLTSEGYVVNAVSQQYRILDETKIAALNAADLVIISRKTDSGSYDDGAEVSQWNGLTSPVLCMSAYLARSVRWNWLDADQSGSYSLMQAVEPADPIFLDVPLDANNQVDVLDFGIASVVVTTDPGNGTVLATRATDQVVWICRWDTGQEFYAGCGQYAGGPRVFCGLGQDISGAAYNITEAGKTVFLNVVQATSHGFKIVGSVTESEGTTEVWEKPAEADTFSVVLNNLPSADVEVTVQPVLNATDIQIDGSTGAGEAISLVFTPADWYVPQTVAVRAIPDELEEGTEYASIEFDVHSSDPDFDGGTIYELEVAVFDSSVNDCPEEDFNHDCRIDLNDLVQFSLAWLGDGTSAANLFPDDTIDLNDLLLFSQEWLNYRAPVIINEFMASNGATLLDGDNQSSDWIELYNMTESEIDLGGWYLTDEADQLMKWRFPEGVSIRPYGYLLVFASGKDDLFYPYTDAKGYLHTNFSLDASGDYLALIASDGQTVVHEYAPEYLPQEQDISYGLYKLEKRYFTSATPLLANSSTYEGLVGDTKFSHKRGFYSTAFDVTVSCDTPDSIIHYTLDGSTPSETSPVYTEPISITTTTCLRAAAFKAGWHSSNTDTQTYLFIQDVTGQAAPSNYPNYWDGYAADYEMDPEVYDAAEYSSVIEDAMLSLPALSLVTDMEHLFDSSTGIYQNTTQEGELWERPVSMEFIDPSGTEKNFQEDCGIRIQGGASRNPNNSPKHSLRLLFKSIYGESKLDYPFFGDDGADSFDTLVLRANYNNSWIHWDPSQRLRSQYLRDQFARDTQLAMGRMSVHGRFVHLYINGLYWGLYNVTERPQASFAANYYGGEKEEWDALNAGVIVDGDATNWNTALSIAAAGVADDAGYAALSEYVDIPNLIDYMLINFYGGNQDWGAANWYAAGRKTGTEKFKFFCWDTERTLEDPILHNVTGVSAGNSPAYFYSKLRANPEFRMQFADHAHRFLFNGGLLTPEACIARWMERAGQIDSAVIGESARWGDYRRDVHVRGTAYLYTRNEHWISEQTRLVETYFPQRTDVLIEQLRNASLYPAIDAPVFAVNDAYQHGGYVETGDILTMSNPNSDGLIYYTMDGTDPRLSGGDVSPTANIFYVGQSTSEDVELIPMGSVWKYLYDGSDQGTAWRLLSFMDDSWGTGAGQLGFGDGDETTDIGPADNSRWGAYFRHTFTVSNPADIAALWIDLLYDDSAVVYINGQEIDRLNLPEDETIVYNTPADGAVENVTTTISGIDPSVLVSGINILAVEVHQNKLNSTDLSFDLRLSATVTTSNNSEEPLIQSTCVKARVLDNGTWSALNEASYAVGPVAESLRITELMYHPVDPNCEYIELRNIGSQAINLSNVQLTRGVTFTFPSLELASGEYILVVKDLSVFGSCYDTAGMNIAGQYVGSLENGGEKIQLNDAAGEIIHLFDYKDGWYNLTDGAGFSLTIKDEYNSDLTLWDQKAGWRPSATAGGSPCTDDTGVLPPLGAIVFNEVLAHSHATYPDWIELYNTTDSDINIGGWFLSDSDVDDPNIMKYEIGLDTVIPGYGYKVFYQDEHFGNTDDPGCHVPFALSEGGEAVYLHSGTNGIVTGYVEEEDFGASESGVAFGRYYKSSTDSYNFVAMSVNTPGKTNAYPKVGPVVISQIMYNPPEGGSYDHDEYEYIQLRNIGDQAVDLEEYDALMDCYVSWAFTNGIDYAFPPGTSIPAEGSIVVVKNIAAFNERYPDIPAGLIYGPYDGKLSNNGEKVDLSKPGDEENGDRYYILVDRVNYSNGSNPEGEDPWPTAADGLGSALGRIDDESYGNDVANWQAAVPTPGD